MLSIFVLVDSSQVQDQEQKELLSLPFCGVSLQIWAMEDSRSMASVSHGGGDGEGRRLAC